MEPPTVGQNKPREPYAEHFLSLMFSIGIANPSTKNLCKQGDMAGIVAEAVSAMVKIDLDRIFVAKPLS